MSPAILPTDGETVDPIGLLTAYQHSAVVAAATRTGVADAIAHQAKSADAVAAELGLHGRGTDALLGAMVALGLAAYDDDGYRLTAGGAQLASDHPKSIVRIVEKEWFFYRAWMGLEQTVRDGHAQIAPWPQRLQEDPAQSHAFLRALDDLCGLFGGELPGLSGVSEPGRLLDVGGGTGCHAANLAAAVPGIEPTVLDLADVEPVLRERHPELPFEVGDLFAPRFGRPEGEQWDYVLLGNILHDQTPERCAEIVRTATALLRPGGTLIAYDWPLPEDRANPGPVALFSLMMMVENEGGGAWRDGEVTGWLSDAGLEDVRLNRGFGPIAAITGKRPS